MSAVASSSEETLLLTPRGEVLVCHHLEHSNDQRCGEEELTKEQTDIKSGCNTESQPGHVGDGDYDIDIFVDENAKVRNSFYCPGDNSPTPVMSFDYYGYEPPTPEPIRPRDGVKSDPSSTSRFSSQEQDHLNLIQPGGKNGELYRPLPAVSDPSFSLPGVPKFLHHLSQIRITNLSAHPRGRHVLLVSEEGLLFSYGSNECGQLGLGQQSLKRSTLSANEDQMHCHTVTTPSIVTPLLENGGKSLNCAAGVDYSLVVVKTEGARIARRKKQNQQQCRPPLNASKELSSSSLECNAHHQMYGFGNNNHRKLGLLDNGGEDTRQGRYGGHVADARKSINASSPSSVDSSPGSFTDDGVDARRTIHSNYVFLPRRVALHCKAVPRKPETTRSIGSPEPPPYGIFSIAASINHSAALVRRPSGAIELYTWGSGDESALGLKHASIQGLRSPEKPPSSQSKVTQKTVLAPTILSPISSGAQNHPSLAHETELSARNPDKLAPNNSHILDARSHGEPSSLLSPSEYLVKVTLGPSCTHVITSMGRWLAFGSSEDGLLGLGENVCCIDMPTEVRVNSSVNEGAESFSQKQISTISVGDSHAFAVTSQGEALSWGRSTHGALCLGTNKSGCLDQIVSSPQPTHFCESLQFAGSMGAELDKKLMQHVHTRPPASMANDSNNLERVACAHAGLDATVFVQESGSVLSCGKGPQFGGMKLWSDEYSRFISSS